MLVLVNDNLMLGQLIAENLGRCGVPALAIDATGAAAFLGDHTDVGVVVINEQGAAGRETCRVLRATFPDLGIVQLGEGTSTDDIDAAYRAGADIVVPMRPRLDELIAAVTRLGG